MENLFSYADELGPVKIIHVHEPSIKLKGILVIDNVAAGPSIGGLRMAPDVSTGECVRLARAMTLKNAAAGLPHGGGKSVLYGDPKMPEQQKEELIRGFASALKDEQQYIFGPDMGTNETCMAWIRDEIGRSVGLPREVGGIPLDEIGATGWGLSRAVDEARKFCDFEIQNARVAVQGFGAVGKHAVRFLSQQGAVTVAVSDSSGTIYDPDGLNVKKLIALKEEGKSVTEYPGAASLARDDIIDIECDIWIPAARPDVINQNNVHRLNTKLIAEGANIPVTIEAEEALHKRGILCIPDFIANAGGVISAAMEYQGASQSSVLSSIEEKLRKNTLESLLAAKRDQVTPRDASLAMARKRLDKAMSFRRWSIY